jgi:hypothetical protein
MPHEISVVGRALNGRIEPFFLDSSSIGIFSDGKKTLDDMLWEEAWPSLLKVLLAAVSSLFFLVSPVMALRDCAVEDRASRR